MNKRFILLLSSFLFAFHAFPQMYILNEDFNGTSGTTPPAGWNIVVITGNSTDTWHFDNPGQRTLNYPITDPFAIFDSDSTSANGEPEEVALETPLFDASTSNYILLHFVHTLLPGSGGSAKVEAFDGDAWQEVITYTSATSNPSTEVLDLSSYTGGITNARLRFTWSGNGSGYWAVDNIRIYASLPLDGGIVSIDSPNSPVVPGVQNVEITIGNFGYNPLTSTKIDWTADGIAQPSFNWVGSIGFGQTESNVIIGTYDFQDPVQLKVWQSGPNGQSDLNPYNDTVSKYLVAALCGSYTIGGNDPDFVTFSQAADVLNTAGVTCPVTFLVRDGTYYEQFILKDIQGASQENTITFRSESGDSTLAILKIIPGALKYEPMVFFDGSRYINFQELGIFTGSAVGFANNAFLFDGAGNINIERCLFEVRNPFDFGISIQGGSQNIEIAENNFVSISARASSITIAGELTSGINIRENVIKGASDGGYTTIKVDNYSSDIELTGNQLDQCYRAIHLVKANSVLVRDNTINNSNEGIYVDNLCSNIEISGNRLTHIKSHPNVPNGTAGITVNNASNINLFNNFVHTAGDGPAFGVNIQKSSLCKVNFNSIYITNDDTQGRSSGVKLSESDGISAKNNILHVMHGGSPVYIDEYQPQLDFDHNDYYNLNQKIGYYDGTFYTDLAAWADATDMDLYSRSVDPFYTSMTDLSMNQVLLNNAGVPVAGIEYDIDSVLRNPANPDIGAKEYNPCSIDAGINAVAGPENPLIGGTQNVIAKLQNQGTNTLTSVLINWMVNDEPQTSFPWTGSLGAGASLEVTVGNYNFQPGLFYILEIWTENPNNTSDCNKNNDTITSRQLAVPLCGTYTIGGNAPDFLTLMEAVNLLNLAGITCPVTFLVRDGIYYEQFVIKEIQGTSSVNIVTFRSESGDSTKAVIQIDPGALKFESMIYLTGSEYITFQKLGFITGATTGSSNNAVLAEGAKNIVFNGCYFESKKESDFGIVVQKGSREIEIRNSRFNCSNYRAGAINLAGDDTRDIIIAGNQVQGATDWKYYTIKIGNGVRNVHVTENYIEKCYSAIYLAKVDSVFIRDNVISTANDGICVDDWCKDVEISGNRLVNITSHDNAPDGTSGILVDNATEIDIFNNFVHTWGNGPGIGINLQNTTQCRVIFNSLNLTNIDSQGKSKGIMLKTSSAIQVLNNIFNVTNLGTPVYITAYAPQLVFDRNNYFSFDQTIGYYNGKRYNNLATWADSVNMDMNSLSVMPFYSSETDLSINQALLNNAGSVVTGITVDIDGTVRDPLQPDIGAKEYSLCQIDAGINAITSPGNILTGGPEEVKVLLQNQGSAILTSAKINWLINDDLQTPYVWSGNLAVGANAEISLGNYNFQNGISYVLQIWTTEPNSTSDCNHKNDTIKSRELSGALCGTYTIGGANADFLTFARVADVLNTAGITCPVTFNVRDGIYIEKIIIEDIKGSSEVNTITFKSESGDSTLAVIQMDPAAMKFESIIFLNGTQNIKFQGLGLSTGPGPGEANYAILMDAAKNIELSGCYFEVRNKSDYCLVLQGGSQQVNVTHNRLECTDFRAGAINISGIQTRDINIDGNIIKGPPNWGYTLVNVANNVRKVNITGNNIERSYRSIYMTGADSILVNGNTIKNTNDGIYVDNQCSNIEISQNRLINIQSIQNAPEGTNGIFVQNSDNIDIINNFVQTGGNGPVLGINVLTTDSCRVYYNSVNVTNTDAQGKSKGFTLKSCSQILVRNNIFCIKNNGLPIHIDVDVTNLNLDYNNYYNPAGIIGKVNDQVYSNLFNWGQTVNGDANSKAVNPYFKADSIALPFQRVLNGAGIPISGILFDIDGKLRYSQAPDIGCTEFFVDYGILELLNPTLNCFHTDVDSVIVYISQFGDVPFADLKVAYQLDNGPVHIDTIPGPLIEDIIHTFGTTENISAPGEYLFKIWLINTLDDNIINDTLKAMRYSKPPPVVSMEYDNFCTGWEVNFTGHATVAEPYYIDHYEWLFGDGGTSEEQNPVHAYQAPGTYAVACRAYSDAGCYGEIITSIFIDPDFLGLNLDYNLVKEICPGDSTGSLELIAYGGYPPYRYFVNGVEVQDSLVSQFTSGNYEISVIDAQNCTRKDSVESYPLINMNPQIQANPLSGYTPLTVAFDFTAEGAASWLWHFTENDTDTATSPSFTFFDFGHHEVILEVQSGHPYYCIQYATIDIFVDIIVIIEANSVFTPNSDDYNDFFEIKTVGVKEMKVNIFNQWGNRIYEMEEVGEKWDGNTKGGAKAPDGTYFWALEAKGYNDLVYERQGSVLLLRHGSTAYPDPVTSKVKMVNDEQLQAPVIVSVYSVFGQLAHSEIINDPDNIVLDISHLRSGIYIIKASDGNRDCFVRIIKN